MAKLKKTFIDGKSVFNMVFPVGSIYLSVNNVNPQTYFGGQWQSWGKGRVPLGVGNNGESSYASAEQVGGSENSVAQHIHTQAEHAHSLLGNSSYANNVYGLNGNYSNANVGVAGGNYALPNNYITKNYLGNQFLNNVEPAINSEGILGGNMPPYITCCMWKRIE